MEALHWEGFEIEHDAARTRAAWAEVARGAAEACGCEVCAAYVAQRAQLIDQEARDLLQRLGLDPERESELAQLGPGEFRGTVWVVASWAFAGALRSRPPMPKAPVDFQAPPERAPEALREGPVASVQLELELTLPKLGPPDAS